MLISLFVCKHIPRETSIQVILNSVMLAADCAGRPDRSYNLLRAMQRLGVEADVVSIATLGTRWDSREACGCPLEFRSTSTLTQFPVPAVGGLGSLDLET